jgi:transcriptional regulator with XRE-family HTH domain
MAFLLGSKDGSAVSHVERGAREPSLRSAFACEVMFGVPARELFPGTYEEVEQELKTRAQTLSEQSRHSTSRLASYKEKFLKGIISPKEFELAEAV